MDLANLSSNWNKLKSTLKPDKTHEHAINTNGHSSQHTPPRAKQLKRKTPDSNRPRPTNDVARKRQRLAPPLTGTSNKARKMGAYISSLPTASYALNPPPTQDAAPNADPDALPTAALTPSTPTDPIALAGKYIALDCEMVGTHSPTPFSTPAHSQSDQNTPEYSILARVSLVTYALQPLYDAYVLPPPGVAISDYRTPYSGITPWHLSPTNTTTTPRPFAVVQSEVAALLAGRVLVGHALKNDLAVLGLSHPRRDVRDTARHPPFRALAATVGKDGKVGKGRTPSLKRLAAEVLGWTIQGDERRGHSSVEDARAAMALFRKEKSGFEREVMRTFGRGRGGGLSGVGPLVRVKVENGRSGVGNDEEAVEGESEDEDDEAISAGQKKKRKGKRKKRTKR